MRIKLIGMQYIKQYLTLLFLSFAMLSWSQNSDASTTKILFIGNSYTYYNSLPELVKGLAEEKFPNRTIETKLVSQGGMTLKRHWDEKRALEVINSEPWDYVVLQEQSKLGMGVMIENEIYFGQTDLFYKYARKFDAEIKKSGAKTVFFMTWSTKNRPEDQEILTYAYTSIAKELGAMLAPVGMSWDELRTNNDMNFYSRDGSHPSATGSYLAASTLFSTLFKANPIGLSGEISGAELSSSGLPGEKRILTNIASNDAALIQNTSWSVVKSIQELNGYPSVKKPEPKYSIPTLNKGDDFEVAASAGRWYGTSSYGFNYLGFVMDIENNEEEVLVDLSFFSPDQEDKMDVKSAEVMEGKLIISMHDPLRNMDATLEFVLDGTQMHGLLETHGAITMYKHLELSKEPIQDGINLEAFTKLMKSFQANILRDGYVKSAVEHYMNYSKLIGKTYTPEERYLNAQGFNFLREGKNTDAFNQFELALHLYPNSINSYVNYAEALHRSGNNKKAVLVYTKGYELAKNQKADNLKELAEGLKRLKEERPAEPEMAPPPPPLPPPAVIKQ